MSTLPVQPERGVVLSFNEPVPPFATIDSPRLHRERLVDIILMPCLLVRLFNDVDNDFGAAEAPDCDSLEYIDLCFWSMLLLPRL